MREERRRLFARDRGVREDTGKCGGGIPRLRDLSRLPVVDVESPDGFCEAVARDVIKKCRDDGQIRSRSPWLPSLQTFRVLLSPRNSRVRSRSLAVGLQCFFFFVFFRCIRYLLIAEWSTIRRAYILYTYVRGEKKNCATRALQVFRDSASRFSRFEIRGTPRITNLCKIPRCFSSRWNYSRASDTAIKSPKCRDDAPLGWNKRV